MISGAPQDLLSAKAIANQVTIDLLVEEPAYSVLMVLSLILSAQSHVRPARLVRIHRRRRLLQVQCVSRVISERLVSQDLRNAITALRGLILAVAHA